MLRHSAILACVACLLLPVAGYGQESNALNPDSPAGVEYALPLEQARKNAAKNAGQNAGRNAGRSGGDAESKPQGGRSLFGAGIASKGAGSRDGGNGGTASGEGGTASGDDDLDGSLGDGPGNGPGTGSLQTSGSDGGAATLRFVGIGLAVLVAGGLLGVLLRRGLRQPGG